MSAQLKMVGLMVEAMERSLSCSPQDNGRPHRNRKERHE
jgi:hypothetical protein